MYGKKIIAVVAMVSVVTLSAAMFAAFEAHVVNVTAHIENALAVNPQEIEFGKVFPQEYLEDTFTIGLSKSFMNEDQTRVKDVQYKIVSKPKCKIIKPCDDCPTYAPVGYATHECPEGYAVMKDLCAFLSKMPIDPETGDIGVPSYFHNLGGDDNYCEEPANLVAEGHMEKCLDSSTDCGEGDIEDCWTVDLKVPPVDGYIAQDWPLSCADWTVAENNVDYGCDLWIEVTGFSYF